MRPLTRLRATTFRQRSKVPARRVFRLRRTVASPVPKETARAYVVGSDVDLDLIRSRASFAGAITWADDRDLTHAGDGIAIVFARWDSAPDAHLARVLERCDANAWGMLVVVLHRPGEVVPERIGQTRLVRWGIDETFEDALCRFATALIAPVLFPGPICVDYMDLLAVFSAGTRMHLFDTTVRSAGEAADCLLRESNALAVMGSTRAVFACMGASTCDRSLAIFDAFAARIEAAVVTDVLVVLAIHDLHPMAGAALLLIESGD